MLGNTPGKNQVYPLPDWSKFWPVDSLMKTYATSRNLFACRLADCGSLFFISVNFWNHRVLVSILLSQNRIQLLSSFYFCFWVFVKESAAKRFTDGCLCNSLCGILRRTAGKIILTFQSFSLRVLPLAAKKWNSAAIKILLLFEPVLFIWFGLRKASERDFNESNSFEHACFYSRFDKKFFFFFFFFSPNLTAFRSYIQG